MIYENVMNYFQYPSVIKPIISPDKPMISHQESPGAPVDHHKLFLMIVFDIWCFVTELDGFTNTERRKSRKI